eukprot:CAMPEP_0181297762 /NCGR_PEP_ID=MMETSP1101-20121128/5418_1 /TAXON_ID=46948 /ORGANISM="Rhodomonas abbreviata, Strain Caron Lab Isolate" /LENGTH=650 /DNA_ID=CAMNT_0023402731 /DNA_START=97 /DNA_END=2046 /DNA_ORIENTATION=-
MTSMSARSSLVSGSRSKRAPHVIMAVCFSSASIFIRRTGAFTPSAAPSQTVPRASLSWLSTKLGRNQLHNFECTRKLSLQGDFANSDGMWHGASSQLGHNSHSVQTAGHRPRWMLQSSTPGHPPLGTRFASLPAFPAGSQLRSGPAPLFAMRPSSRGASYRAGGGRKEPVERLMPAERRLLERRRRDGTISAADLTRLSRAERATRVERERSAPREPFGRPSSHEQNRAAANGAGSEQPKPPRRKRERPPWALGEARQNELDDRGEVEDRDQEVERSRALEPIASLTSVKSPTSPPAGGSVFGGIPCDSQTTAALKEAGIEYPLPIQGVAMVALLAGRSAVLHSPTGSGKTLTFLLPLIARLNAGGNGRLRGIIMAPTRELALQITSEITAMKGMAYAYLLVGGTQEAAQQLEELRNTKASILVASPDRLLKVLEIEVEQRGMEAKSDVIGNLETVVIDEVDRMLSALSKYATMAERKKRAKHPKPSLLILQRVTQHHHLFSLPLQLVACSATVGRPMRKELARVDLAFELKALPVLTAAIDPDTLPPEVLQQLPRAREFDSGRGPTAQGAVVPPTILHRFVSVSRLDDRYAVLQHLLLSVCETRPALLFLKDGDSVSKMVATLRYSGVPRAMALHEAMGFAGYDSRNAT